MSAPVGYTAGTSFAWNTRGQVISAATVLPAIGLICVGLRFWSRLHKKIGIGIDDILILPALLCVIGIATTLLFGVVKGVVAHTTPANSRTVSGSQMYQITSAQKVMEKIEWVFFFINIIGCGSMKLSVLFLYRRIFAGRGISRFDIVSKIAIAIVAAWTIGYIFAEIFRCGKNAAALWGPLIELSNCHSAFKFDNGFYISDLITDMLVVGLPIPVILKLHMPLTRKLGVIGVLLLGVISCVASIVRIIYGLQIAAAGLASKTDVDEGLTTLLYWGMVEAGIGLIATNLPSHHSLFTISSIKSFLASLRGQISLTSRGASMEHSRSIRGTPFFGVKETGSYGSREPALRGVDTVVEGHDDLTKVRVSKPKGLHIKKDLRQVDEMV